jgi:hypothetical protein
MSQNRSSAVMQQRAEPHDSLDFFPTPPWATRALFEHVIGKWPGHIGWDPACGDGAIVRVLDEYMLATAASDIHDYGLDRAVVHDFLQPFLPDGIGMSEWIVTNPPFRLGEQFINRGLEIATHGVAMLVRTSFVESIGRYKSLFRDRPPAIVAQYVERVPMVKGRLDRKASTATSYCWLIWVNQARDWEKPNWVPKGGTRFVWIPPCRSKLERDDDYQAPELLSHGKH